MKRLSDFKKIEESEDDNRSDKHEALAAWLQPEGLHINFPSYPELNIAPEDFASPFYMSLAQHDYLHIFCMYAVHTGRFECIDGLIDYAVEEEAEVKKQMKIHDKCLEFGKYAVIIKPVDFFNRVGKAIGQLGYTWGAKLVDYYDPNLHNGFFPGESILFNKQQKFSYQNEYRIVVNNGTVGDDPLFIEVGDLSDISAKIESSSLNLSLKMESIKV